MREIVLDTETTGLSAEDRVVEIGCVEISDLLPTGRTFHVYINPQRQIPAHVTKIHGLTNEFLKRKPTFGRIVDKFLAFLDDAPIVAHNASFDTRMLNAELARLGQPPLNNWVIDTLDLSREVRKGAGKHTLDAICDHYKIDRKKRTQHGALIDAEILAEAYLQLRGGRQHGFELVVDNTEPEYVRPDYGPRPFRSRITVEELSAHATFVATLKNPIWAEYLNPEMAEAA